MTRLGRRIVMVFIVTLVFGQVSSADWYKFKKNPLKRIEKAVKQGAKDLDVTNRDSSIREHLRKNDPWNGFKRQVYWQSKARYLGTNFRSTRLSSYYKNHLERAVALGVLPQTRVDTIRFSFGRNTHDGAEAMTFGDFVILKRPYRDQDPRLLVTMAHELVHVSQFRKLGERRFAEKYGNQWVQGGFSYDRIGLEQEAARYENRFQNWLESYYRQTTSRQQRDTRYRGSRFIQPSTFPQNRTSSSWQYTHGQTQGEFRKQGNRWVEYHDRRASASFEELRADDDRIFLFDPSRRIYVALTQTRYYWSRDGKTWNAMTQGRFVER